MPMYSKTSLGADQLSVPSLSPRGRRILWAGIAAVIALCLAAGAWIAAGTDDYASSANGCVSFNIPNTMGGALIHHCGNDARAFCAAAYTHSDRLSLLGRPECARAGLTRAALTSRPAG